MVSFLHPSRERRRCPCPLGGSNPRQSTVLSEGFQTTLLEALAERGRVVTFTVPGAQVLADQGNPVVITAERTVESLVSALRDFLNNPPALGDPTLINAWTWPVRAASMRASPSHCWMAARHTPPLISDVHPCFPRSTHAFPSALLFRSTTRRSSYPTPLGPLRRRILRTGK